MPGRANPFAQQWSQFQDNTSSHQLVALRDDGLYKHLRMQGPGSRIPVQP